MSSENVKDLIYTARKILFVVAIAAIGLQAMWAALGVVLTLLILDDEGKAIAQPPGKAFAIGLAVGLPLFAGIFAAYWFGMPAVAIGAAAALGVRVAWLLAKGGTTTPRLATGSRIR